MNPLNDEWILWVHNPKDENWDLESYKKVVTLKPFHGGAEKMSSDIERHLRRYFDLHGNILPPVGLYNRVLKEHLWEHRFKALFTHLESNFL